MARTAIGRIAGPDKPPVLPPKCGRIVSTFITIPTTVLIRARASAPASTTPRAIDDRSVTSGESLAIIGNSPPMVRRTPSITRLEASGSHAKTRPRFSTLGQEIFTSIALIPETERNLRARVEYSSTVSPAIETMILDRCSIRNGMSLAMNASIPGPCNPMELSIPLGVSAIRGVGRPVLAFIITDLVTTPPISLKSKNCDSSRPELAQPLAVKVGAGNHAFPSVVEKSKAVIAFYQLCPIEHAPRP